MSSRLLLTGALALSALSAVPAHAASAPAADTILHRHRIVAYDDIERLGQYVLVQLGDTGPKGAHGVQTVQVHFAGSSFSAGRGDVTDVTFSSRPPYVRDVSLRGRVARATGGRLRPGDTWQIGITYAAGYPKSVTAYPSQNLVTVGAFHAGHQVLWVPFGGGNAPYISVK